MRSFLRPSVARFASHLATLAFALAGLLQVAVALGLLPITMIWGGSQHVLTPLLRLTSLLAASIFALAAGVIRRRAGLIGTRPPGTAVKVLAWGITAYLALNTLMNIASPSMGERLIFAPLSFALAVLCLIVSLSKSAGDSDIGHHEAAYLLHNQQRD